MERVNVGVYDPTCHLSHMGTSSSACGCQALGLRFDA